MPNPINRPARDTSAQVFRARQLDQNPNPLAQDEAIEDAVGELQPEMPLERTEAGDPIAYRSGINPMVLGLVYQSLLNDPNFAATDSNMESVEYFIRHMMNVPESGWLDAIKQKLGPDYSTQDEPRNDYNQGNR